MEQWGAHIQKLCLCAKKIFYWDVLKHLMDKGNIFLLSDKAMNDPSEFTGI